MAASIGSSDVDVPNNLNKGDEDKPLDNLQVTNISNVESNLSSENCATQMQEANSAAESGSHAADHSQMQVSASFEGLRDASSSVDSVEVHQTVAVSPVLKQSSNDQRCVSSGVAPGKETSELHQVGTVSEGNYAKGDLSKETAGGGENESPVKHKLTSNISVEDNVFEEGTRATASETTSTQGNSSLPQQSSDKPASVGAGEKQGEEVPEERPVREMLVRRSRTESTDSISDRPHLAFHASKSIDVTKDEEVLAHEVCECLLCDRSYPATDKEDVLAHLVLKHKFVIADVNFIGSLPDYMRYWKKRFQEQPFSEFCSKIVTNASVKDDASKEEFFLLCDALPEDKELREALQRKKLESVLAQQQKEREETKFCRQCLFCTQTFCGNRAVLIDHLVRDHSFHVGRPDNLVYTDEMFDLIQTKLDSLLCLFCEKAFKDKPSLKEHMRKKQHRKINPKHKEYDKFYIVNYMEMGKNWRNLNKEDKQSSKSNEKTINEEDEWSGWVDETDSSVVCLFCDLFFVSVEEMQDHMKEKHNFDLQEVCNKLELKFYRKVKLINYIRKQVYDKTCYGCQQAFESKDELLAHLDEFSNHVQAIPNAEIWDQEQYFLPTYEDDSLLFNLEDDDEDGTATDDTGVEVIQEDIPITDTILSQKLCQELLKSK